MLLSQHYSKKLWTSHERKAAQARAFSENREYILPLKLDDTEVPGILETTGYIDFRNETAESVSQLILKKLWGDISGDRGLDSLKSKFENLYMGTMLACELVFIPSNHESYHKRALALEILVSSQETFAKLKADLQIKSPIIDRLVLSQVIEVMDAFDDILERARFLVNLRNQSFNDYFFIGEIPESNFNKVYDFLSKLRVFEGYAIKRKKHYKPDEIVANWYLAEIENERFLSKPGEFKGSGQLTPMVFNATTLRGLSIGVVKDGFRVKMFKTVLSEKTHTAGA